MERARSRSACMIATATPRPEGEEQAITKNRFSRPNIDYATPCVCNAGLLSNQHENGQATARWIANWFSSIYSLQIRSFCLFFKAASENTLLLPIIERLGRSFYCRVA